MFGIPGPRYKSEDNELGDVYRSGHHSSCYDNGDGRLSIESDMFSLKTPKDGAHHCDGCFSAPFICKVGDCQDEDS